MGWRKDQIGKVVDGYWEVISYVPKNNWATFTLRNIYNHTQIELDERTLKNIINGKSSVSKNVRIDMKQKGVNKKIWQWRR